MVEVRLTRPLYETIQEDLARPHPFAGERVGFAYGRLANVGGKTPLVLLYRYVPVPDEHYIEKPGFAACIGGDAIRATRQEIRNHSGTCEGAFHVHVHNHKGEPRFSRPDLIGLPPLIPGFARPAKDAAHGLLLLSADHGIAWVWLPGMAEPCTTSRIVVVGAPVSIFEAKRYERQ